MAQRTTEESLISPKALRIAREIVELDQESAAKKIGVEPHILKAWETGEKTPTIRQLTQVSKLYRRSLYDFYSDDIHKENFPDYRRLSPDIPPKGLQYFDALYRARRQREVLLLLKEINSKLVPDTQLPPKLSLNHNLEEAGNKLRNYINIDFATQKEWSNEREALRGWIDAIAELGIITIQFSGVEVRAVRGFSIYGNNYPIIAINNRDAVNARIFTLFHELVHIALRNEGICEPFFIEESRSSSNKNNMLEKFCNGVAATALLPKDSLDNFPKIINAYPGYAWMLEELKPISKTLKISVEMLLIRLISIEKASRETYKKIKQELEEQIIKKSKPGRGDYYKTLIQKLGKPYVKRVMTAYDESFISELDVAHYLDITCDKIHKINELI